jgi:hypothetical protein
LASRAACGGNGYEAGYAQGCDSGYVDAQRQDTYAKDEVQYRTVADYRAGWDAGYERCYDDGIRYSMGGGSSGG